MKLFLPLIYAILLNLSALGETIEVHNHTYSVTETAFGADWQLQGSHHFKYKIFFSVLTGALYQEMEGEGERLVFTYTRNIKAEDLVSSSTTHLEKTRTAEKLEEYAELLAEIQGAYTDLEKNDQYAITVLPEKGIWLERDGEVVFHSDNAEFGDWYLDIWLGDPPISEEMKKALLEE
jgi:hypothetical protein